MQSLHDLSHLEIIMDFETGNVPLVSKVTLQLCTFVEHHSCLEAKAYSNSVNVIYVLRL